MAGRAGKKEAGKSKTKPALKKGVGRAKREKQAEEQTHITLEKYRILFESFPLGISITDAAGNLIETNKESERLLGLTRTGHLQRKYDSPEWQIVRPDGTPMPPDEYASVRALKENRRIENVEMGIIKNGDEITWINVTAEPIPLENYGVAITYGDISARKTLEDDLEKQRREIKHIIDSAPIIIFYKDLAGRMIRVNKTFSEALNLSERDILGKTVFDVYSAPIAQAMTDDDQEVLSTGHPKLNIEEPYESASGIRWVRTDKVPIIDDNDRTIGLVGFAQDITERKLAEQALQESEVRFRTSVENMMDAFGIYTAIRNQSGQIVDFRIDYVNAAACLSNQMSKEAQLGKRLSELFPSHMDTGLFDKYCSVVDTGEPLSIESQSYEDVYGGKRLSRVFDISIVKLEDGFAAAWRDVTERKRVEEALLESEKRIKLKLDVILTPQGDIGQLDFEDILDIPSIQSIMDDFYKLTNISAWILDLKGNILVSTGWRDICTQFHRANIETCENCIESDTQLSEGVAPGNFKMYKCKNNMWDLVTPITVGGKHIGNLFLGQFLFDDETVDYELFHSQANRYGFDEVDYLSALERVPRLSKATVKTAMDFYSKFAHMISVLSHSNIKLARSLTEQNSLVNALRTSEEQYRLLSEHTTDTVWLMDMNLKTTYQSPSVEKLRGFTAQEIIGMPWQKHVTPDSLKLATEVISREIPRVLAEPDYNPILTLELEYTCKDGTTVWAESKFSIIRDESGKPVSILGEARDITERMKTDELLRESEARYRLLSEHMTDTIRLMDMNLKTTYLSPSAEKLRGFTYQEVLELPLEKQLTPESLRLATGILSEELPRVEADPGYNPVHTIDLEYYCKDGTTIWEESKFSVIRDNSGKAVSILAEARDITERMKADELLRASEAQYRLLSEHITDIVWLMDMNLKTTYQSPSVQKVTGFTPQENEETPLEKHLTPESLKIATDAFLEELAKIEADPGYDFTRTLELEFYRKDGTTFWAENTFSLIRDETGRPAAILGEGRDITERKQTEEALRQSEVKYRTVLEQIDEAYYEVDLAGNLTFFNDATCRQLGYSAKELKGMNYRVYISKDDIQRVYEMYNQVYRTGTPKTGFLVSGIRKDGSRLFTENSVLPLRDEDGKIIGFRGVVRDITERLQAEAALRESEAQYRLLSEHTTDFIWLMDMNLNPTYQSPSAEKHTGFTHEELIELPFEKRMAPESLRLATEMFFKEIPRMMADPDYNPVRKLELEIYRKDGTTLWSENTFSLIRDENGKPVSILGEARDITERREAEKKLERSLAALEKTMGDTVVAISKMVEMKDPFTADHQIRVAQLASAMAKKMNLTEEQITYLNTAATIHDIGKIYVPSDILSKPGKLGPIEFQIIQTHVQGSYDILKAIDFSGPIAQIVYQHHERLDGSGYPRGLMGADILPEAKILIVADVVEAMSSHRPYRASLGIEKALEEITDNRGSKYDEAAVDACLNLFKNDQFEFKPI